MEMDKHQDTSTWLKFFKDAGIPTKTGASYALIFVENRIHKDMLSELTVDYLRLMGITLMGDIIAILRHAKSVHQDSLRRVVILQSREETPKSVTSSSSSSSDSEDSEDIEEMPEVTKAKEEKPQTSTRTLEHIKKDSPPRTEAKQIKSKVIGKLASSATVLCQKKSGENTLKTSARQTKRKYSEIEYINKEDPVEIKTTSTTNSGKSILKTPTSSAKKIRVTTENDIIGPKLPPSKKTVFERLGAETSSPQVSSTTETLKPDVLDTKFTRMISTVPLKTVKIIDDVDIPPQKPSSVFARLGEPKEDSHETKRVGSALEYVGVLKSPPTVTKKPVLIKRVCTMRADESEVSAKLRAEVNKPVSKSFNIKRRDSSLRNRLKPERSLSKAGMLRRKLPSTKSEGIFANPDKTINPSVKERLGLTKTSRNVSSARDLHQRFRSSTSASVKKRGSTYADRLGDEEDDSYVFPSHVELIDSKKVSFGRVEQKLISHLNKLSGTSLRDRGNKIRTGIHSRLGSSKYRSF